MIDEAAKPWWQTRRTWGFIIGILSVIAGFAGYDIDKEATLELALQASTLIGLVIAWWGGVRASGPISAEILPKISRDSSDDKTQVVIQRVSADKVSDDIRYRNDNRVQSADRLQTIQQNSWRSSLRPSETEDPRGLFNPD